MQEVIEQVLAAEQQGEKILQQARKEADAIISQKSEEAGAIISKAKEESARILRESSNQAAAQVAAIRKAALDEHDVIQALPEESFDTLVDKLVDLVGKGA